MWSKIGARVRALGQRTAQAAGTLGSNVGRVGREVGTAGAQVGKQHWRGALRWSLVLGIGAAGAYGVYRVASHQPLAGIAPGELGVRVNRLTGGTTVATEGSLLVIPQVHELRRIWLREQTYRPARGEGETPYQSIEGLALGVDLTVRYGLERQRLAQLAATLPQDIGAELVEPRVQGVIYKVFSRYTVKEIFSSKRAEIQQAIEAELAPQLAGDGIVLRALSIGKIELPREYRAGMDALLAEELATEKMRFTLDLKDKLTRQSALEAEAEKARRDKAAEAAANEQVIAARAQAEAMKHVLPFKEKQIEQRKLEAEAEKIARLKTAEASAEARRIEAAGEADSRRKLAEAEAYRMEITGRAASAQMARDGAVLSQHPLLIQKTMADKLSDKVSVIIAPMPADGGFIGNKLLGNALKGQAPAPAAAPAQEDDGSEPQ
jgi:regulator of protease activity HflC (stomatin/prohibitin superfamily)